MADVIVNRIVNAPLQAVWDSWDAFSQIASFNPLLSDSYLIDNSPETGVGACRQCVFSDGKNYVREKIIVYSPQSQLVLDVYAGTVPVSSAITTLDFKAMGPDRSRVTMRMAFEPKYWIVGRIMAPAMKRQFAKMLGQLLDGNAAFVERGINSKAA